MSRIAILYKTLGLLLILAIVMMAYRLDLHHQHSRLLDAHQISDHLEKQIHTLKTDMAKKNIYASELSDIQTSYNNTVVLAFPAQANFKQALKTVSDKVTSQGLQVANMTSLSPIQKDFYVEIPVKVTVLGTYTQLLNFMELTSTWNGPLFLWKNWTLTHQSKAHTTVLNEKTQNNLLEMNVDAVFFTLP